MNDVCLTFDLDWAPEPIIDDLTRLLAGYQLNATIFCTHRSPAVERLLALPGSECAVHPNFLGADGATPARGPAEEARILGELLDLFPEAGGVRNHVLYFNSRLIDIFHEYGISYFSNDLMFLQNGLRPRYDYSGLLRLPIYWEDDVHCAFFAAPPGALDPAHEEARAQREFTPEALGLDRPGLKVLDFHPVHVYLNTRTLDDYRRAKPLLDAPEALQPQRRQGHGVRTLLCAIAERLSNRRSPTLGEVADAFRTHERYVGRYRVTR